MNVFDAICRNVACTATAQAAEAVIAGPAELRPMLLNLATASSVRLLEDRARNTRSLLLIRGRWRVAGTRAACARRDSFLAGSGIRLDPTATESASCTTSV